LPVSNYRESTHQIGGATRTGVLIVNADDWGRDHETTERIAECVLCRTVSSVSAMVFMEDSERSAAIARERGIDAGLHVNLTTPFSGSDCAPRLVERQNEVAAYLSRHRLAQVIYNPALIRSFEYVVKVQLDEFARLYGAGPNRIDGHHHMHLCANVLMQRLLPPGTIVRRNFSLQLGEKGVLNRLYRKVVDKRLARQHDLTDFFFSLPPLEPQSRLERILALAHQFTVEVETHPVKAEEYHFLTRDGIERWIGDFPIARGFVIPREGRERRSDT
jgi:predicted glycoside hydrolase/deacetylase ChbG (UPF0249 family)